jgi:haloacetate dehalogenase
MAEYERCFSGLKALHAACEDYRASAGIDLEHDRQSDAEGRRLSMPVLVLWGARGIVGRLFEPLADWRAKSDAKVQGFALPAGHFVAEEVPDLLLQHLLPFLAGA